MTLVTLGGVAPGDLLDGPGCVLADERLGVVRGALEGGEMLLGAGIAKRDADISQ